MCVVVEKSPHSAKGWDDLLWLTATLRLAWWSCQSCMLTACFLTTTDVLCFAVLHTHPHTCTCTAFSSIGYIMGTQIFIGTTVFKCNTRRDSQISNPILLSGLYLYKQAFCTDRFTLPPLLYHSLVFPAKPRQSCMWGCCLGLTLGVWIQWQSYIWELSGKTIPFLTCAVRRGCSFLQGG